MRTTFSLLCGVFLCLVTASVEAAPATTSAATEAMMLRLRDGTIRWGSIRGHDPEAVEFVDIGHGGVARVPWSLLDPRQESELRQRYGYVDETGDELMIEADRLVMIDGREIVGRIVSRTDTDILVKQAGKTIPVPKARIAAAATTVTVPAIEVYTREELYNQEFVRVPPDDPAGQFELAQFCERILDFAHAKEHYALVQQLDPTFREDDVKWALERAEEKAARQDQIDYLAGVDLLTARKKFDQALELAEAFGEMYPDSPLYPDAKKKTERVEKARRRATQELVIRRWYSSASQLARRGASKSYEEILGYLDETLGEEIFAAVLADARKVWAEVDEDDVRQMWIERENRKWRLASYGLGTWLIGEDAALKGMEDEEPDSKPDTSRKDDERKELEERIKRFLENQELQRKAKSSAAQAEERDETWRSMSSTARSGWILAYYAENSGDMEIRRRAAFRACRECAGRGVREVIATGSARTPRPGEKRTNAGMYTVKCPTCMGLGVIRRVYYR